LLVSGGDEQVMIYRDVVELQAPTGAATYLYGDRIKSGKIARVFTSAVVNKTSSTGTRMTIGIEDRGEHTPIMAWTGAIAALLVESSNLVYWLLEGERPYAYIEDATTGDNLLFVVHGEHGMNF
jgi:hypothetical protein